MTAQWVRDFVESVLPHEPLKIGKRYHHKGRTVEITSGQYWGTRGLSNFWYWRPVLADGSLGAEEHGYDNEGAFSPVES